jgi:putative hydroxymethylpyrimidine transporter CytX
MQLPVADGIEPVPAERRTLGLVDQGALWANLGVSLVGVVTGASLVPAIGFDRAVVVVLVGGLVGGLFLGASAHLGATTALPGMAILRRALGLRGSAVPTVLNVAQLVGWSAVEVWTVASAAEQLIGRGPKLAYYVAAGIAGLALALAGPLSVVRRLLRRYVTPLLFAALFYLLIRLGANAHTGAGGNGSLTTLAALDAVIAYNASWLPLAPDYTRFSARPMRAAAGAALGYFAGATLVFAVGIVAGGSDAVTIMTTVAGGTLAAAILILDESEKTFANVYSTAVSAQNLMPRLSQHAAVVVIGSGATVIAYTLDLNRFFQFLFLVGALFIPLYAAVIADSLRARAPAATAVAWVAGFVLYEWIQPTTIHVLQPFVPSEPLGGGALPASLLSFALAFGIRLAWPARRGALAPAPDRPRPS